MDRSTRSRHGRQAVERIEISAVLIAKDEAAHIAELAASLEGVVDEVVLLDTGSTDDTVELAKRHGFLVFHRPWTDSFAEARNAALRHARGRWVLSIDADERLTTTGPDDVREMLAVLARAKDGGRADGFWLGVDCFNSDDLDPLTVDRYQQVRLFRRERFHFEGRIHEQLRVGAGQREPMFLRAPESLRVRHLGYTPAIMAAKQKAARNRELVEASLRDAARGHDSAARIAELKYEKARLDMAGPTGIDAMLDALTDVARGSDLHQHGTALAATALIRAGRHDDALRLLRETVATPERITSFAVIEATALARSGRDDEAAQLLARIEETKNRYSSELDLFVRVPALEAEILAISGEPAASWRAVLALLDRPVIDLASTAAGIASRSWQRAVLAGQPDSYLAELADLTNDEFVRLVALLPEEHQRAAAGIRHALTRGRIAEPDPRLAQFVPRLAGHSPAAGLEIARARLDTEPSLARGIAEATSHRADATSDEIDAARLLAIRALLLLSHVEKAVAEASALGEDDQRAADDEAFRTALAAMGRIGYAAPMARAGVA